MLNSQPRRDYSELFWNIPVALYRTTPQGNLADANPAMLALLGYDSMEELLAVSVDNLYVDIADRTFYRGILLRDGVLANVEFQLRRKNGEAIWVREYAHQIVDEEGEVKFYEGSLLDISDSVKAEADLRWHVGLQEALAALGQFALRDVGLEALYAEVVSVVARALRVEFCKIFTLLPDKKSLRLVAGVGWKSGWVGETTLAVDKKSQAGYTLLVSHPVVVNDFAQETRFSAPSILLEHDVVSGMSVRVGDAETPYGILGAHSQQARTYSEFEISFLVSVANILAEAIRQRQAKTALEENWALYRTLFENAGEAIQLVNERDEFLDVNARMCEIVGYTRNELLTMTVADLQAPEVREAAGSIVRSEFARYGNSVFESFDVHRDGRIIPVELCISQIYFQEESVYLVIMRDITHQKEAQNDLLRDQELLEKLVEQRTQELQQRIAESNGLNRGMVNLMSDLQTAIEQSNATAVQLEEANRELESFAYSVSHDLRAPLRSISGFAHILATRHRSSLDEQGQKYLDYVVQSGEQMGHLIEDLLAYSRMGRQAVRWIPLDCSEILEGVQSDLMAAIRDNEAVIHAPDDWPPILGDRTLVYQIFLNLMDNAIKYRQPEITPEIWLSIKVDEDAVTIEVRDNGLGIPADYHEKAFDMFQRLHSQSDISGTGIGLALVKKAVSLMNGEISLESEVNKGSTFRIMLPQLNDE